MSDTHLNRLPSDIGGNDAGPIDTVDHGMKFWERQANALRSTLTRKQIIRTDELRRAAEDLGERYSKLQYFEITTSALRALMIEKGYMTEEELRAKMEEVRARFNVPDEMESPIKKGKRR
jgi:Nitrile hydratase beta subunit